MQDAVNSKYNYINKLLTYSQYPHSYNIAYLDSAASNNFGNKQTPLANVSNITNAVPIHLANGQSMKPTHIGLFKNLLSISSSNKQCQICSEQKDGYIVVADSEKCIACKDKPVIKVSRYSTTRMHVINLNNLLQTQRMLYANL